MNIRPHRACDVTMIAVGVDEDLTYPMIVATSEDQQRQIVDDLEQLQAMREVFGQIHCIAKTAMTVEGDTQ